VDDELFWDHHTGDRLEGKTTNNELNVDLIVAEGQRFDALDTPADRPFVHRLAYSFGTDVRPQFYADRMNLLVDINSWCNKLNRMRFFDWSVDAIRQPALPGQDVLSDNGRNLSSVLYAICRNHRDKRNLLSWIEELTPMDAVDFEFPADPTGRVLAALVEKNGQRITVASASDGTLRFLAFLAALLGPHPATSYFFEELENGIHPTRLSLLLNLIENQVKTKGIQIVATTHSPQLLGRLSKESLENASLIYRLENEPDARIIRVLDMPDARRLIKKQRLADLFASGWFENTADYMQPEKNGQTKPSKSARSRKARART
jgi:hypothetical protein